MGGPGLGWSKVVEPLIFNSIADCCCSRCAADLMVETEVRETMVKSFEKMPSEYWNTPQSLSKVGAERFFLAFHGLFVGFC